MAETNRIWEHVQADVELTDEQLFGEWFGIESKFGEYGTPGISETYTNSRFPSINTVDDTANIRWTLYRDESGKLLGAYGSYINKENFEQAFMLAVHPDHQRQGIGTLIINYSTDRHEQELGVEVDFDWLARRANRFTQAGASFANKYVQGFYDRTN